MGFHRFYSVYSMGKWVSVYFNDVEYRKLERILERESRRRGKRLSAYELLKEWVLDRLKKEDGEEDVKPN